MYDQEELCQCNHPRKYHNEFVSKGCYHPNCLCKEYVSKRSDDDRVANMDAEIPFVLGQITVELLKMGRVNSVEIRKDNQPFFTYQISVRYDKPEKICARMFSDVEIRTMNRAVYNIVGLFERAISEYDVLLNQEGKE